MALTAIALNCTLTRSPKASSTDVLLKQVEKELKKHAVTCEVVRCVDLNILPGVKSDEGRGDAWPALRRKVLAADILILGTPIWLGQPSSVAKRVCERMDAFLDEKDDQERMPSYSRVAGVAVVGNEDGAHHVCAEMFQALNDVGFTLPANACTYWVGEAMGDKDYKDLKRVPRNTAGATKMMVANLVHLAALLHATRYPGDK